MEQNGSKERLKKAYDHLYNHGIVHSVTELADKMGRSRPSVSRALNGVPEYLNEKFLIAFVHVFMPIFSLDWMLTGKGEMLTNDKVVEDPKPFDQGEQAALLNRIIDAEKDKNRILERQVGHLEQQVADQRQQIADLRQQLEEYRTRSASISGKVREKNAFELGVAESLESQQHDR